MDIPSILSWLESTSLATRIREGLYLFPVLESIHVIGLALVFGLIAIVDLRLLGVASAKLPFRRMSTGIVRWTSAAFALTAVTGALMFITNAGVYYDNFYFRTKMVLLALAGLNVAAFELTAGRRAREWDQSPAAPPIGRTVAVASLVIWIGVIFTGRMIGFTTSRATVTDEPPPAEINFDDLFEAPPADAGGAGPQ